MARYSVAYIFDEQKGKNAIVLLFCLRPSTNNVIIFWLKEGIFQQIGVYQDRDAENLLANYEKYGMLTMQPDDVYSGLYVLSSECKKLHESDLHKKIIRERKKEFIGKTA